MSYNLDDKFDVDSIMSKCEYVGNKSSFSFIQDIWEKNFGAEFNYLNDNTTLMLISKESINKLQNSSKIPVDCRIFALLYASIQPEGCDIILQKNEKGIEIMVPDNCYYLSLSHKINISQDKNNNKFELKSVLDDNQGQWLFLKDDKYIGIDKNGISKMSLNKWFDYHSNKIKTIIESHNKIIQSSKYDSNDMYFIVKSCKMGILKCNIDEKGLLLALYKYGLLGEIDIVEEYVSK